MRKRPDCGTRSGYVSHAYFKEEACQPCLEAAALYRRDWGEKNRERAREISRSWDLKNPEYARERNNKSQRTRRAALAKVEKEEYTTEQVLEVYGSNCHVCSEQIDLEAPRRTGNGEGWRQGLHLDHVIPISKGGPDTLENVRPAHVMCNLTKGSKDLASTIREESTQSVFI